MPGVKRHLSDTECGGKKPRFLLFCSPPPKKNATHTPCIENETVLICESGPKEVDEMGNTMVNGTKVLYNQMEDGDMADCGPDTPETDINYKPPSPGPQYSVLWARWYS